MAKKKRGTRPIPENDVKAVVALLKLFTDIECRWELREIRKLAKSMLELWRLEKSLPKFVRRLTDLIDKSDEVGVPIGNLGYFIESELRKQK
jgi:hypothetical protein